LGLRCGNMDRLNRWKLAGQLNAYQIALLIAGYDPAEFEDQYEKWPDEVKLDISAYLTAIKNAAKSGSVVFKEVTYEWNNEGSTDWYSSIINIDSLREWMRSRNFSDGFFVASETKLDGLADPEGKFYAPKLAAAVRAWNEVTATFDAQSGKTPKKALDIWLRNHAAEYGLTNKNGNPNDLGIEEISKIANWKPQGGASPTPAPRPNPPEAQAGWVRKVRPNPTTRSTKPPSFAKSPPPSVDEDIPF
jgi:hypothetical protein